jgi:hypothetical protein
MRRVEAPRRRWAALGLGLALIGLGVPALAHRPAAGQPGDEALAFRALLPLAAKAGDVALFPQPLPVTPVSPTVPPPSATPLPPSPEPTDRPCPPLAERLRITSNTVAGPLRANDEYFPLPVAPRPGGGALVAWREQTALKVRVGTFDSADQLVGTPWSFDAEEVHGLVAHAEGGALAVVENDRDIYSAKYCRGPSTPDKALCAKLDVWRFDDRGQTTWRTTVTGKKNVDSDGAHFVWWYQHTARLLWTGSEYGLYYRSADSSPRPGTPGEIDIHAADAFRILDGKGQVQPSAWSWGCSHSWAVRLAFNGHFGSACHGDGYPNAFHVNVLDRDQHLGDVALHANLDPTKRALGGLVPTPDGFWLLHMAQAATMQLHLAFIDNAGKVSADQTLAYATGLPTQYPFRAYLAEYGKDQMLAGWYSGSQLQLAVLDRATGELVTGPVGVPARIDHWNEFVPDPNGDVVWAWSPGNVAKLDLVRVAACR